jgi:hypothetical protein
MDAQAKSFLSLFKVCTVIGFFSLLIIAMINNSFQDYSLLFSAFVLLIFSPFIGLILQIIFICIYEFVKIFIILKE